MTSEKAGVSTPTFLNRAKRAIMKDVWPLKEWLTSASYLPLRQIFQRLDDECFAGRLMRGALIDNEEDWRHCSGRKRGA